MTKKLPAEVKKYLNKFSSGNYVVEPEISGEYKMIVVIPAICEFENFKLLAESFQKNDPKYFNDILILTVVNNSISADEKIKEKNQKLIKYIKSDLQNAGLNYACIDASSPGMELPDKDAGVGLARKTGMDTALKLFDYNKPGKKIILCLDADCIVAPNYLTAVFEEFGKSNYSAGYINFRHQNTEDKQTQLAIVCYEIFLRYYVLGMMYAKSPFAFHTVGSTIFCDHQSYIKVQGMNKKKAAEDFYFLEKLAKITDIGKITSTTVFPSPRESFRVPFGTGKSVTRFVSGEKDEYQLYDPEIFEILKKWNEIFFAENKYDSAYYLSEAEKISSKLFEFLELNKFRSAWDKIIETAKSDEQINRQKKLWFDGFRTMKMIHFLRDNGFPNIYMFNALDILLEKTGNSLQLTHNSKNIPELETQMKYLQKLREIA